jgi:FAD:protein FMN transferase
MCSKLLMNVIVRHHYSNKRSRQPSGTSMKRSARKCSLRLTALWLIASAPMISLSSIEGAQRKANRYEDAHVSMACAYTIVAYGPDEKRLPVAVNAAFDEIDRIDRLMSNYKPESPLSRLNREAADGPIAAEPELYDFLNESLRYARESDGAFDITVGPLMKAWGFFRGEGRMPSDRELTEARRAVGYRHVSLDPIARTIHFDVKGVELDLGGIAKGYAVDRAVAVLKAHGVESALVNGCGSTIYGLGAPPDATAWSMNLRDPMDQRKTAMTVRLKNQALSVSGSYEKFFELRGVRYSHIMDPRTGKPVQGVLSVAVVTDSGTAGDALDNVFYVQGVAWSEKRLEQIPGAGVVFFLPRAKRWKAVLLGSFAISSGPRQSPRKPPSSAPRTHKPRPPAPGSPG